MKQFFHTTFSALKIRNYRLYYFGQIISLSGTFLQAIAQDWLVLKLTNSGVMLGLVSACQFLPMLVLTPLGGVLADRFSKFKLLCTTQTLAGILTCTLGILVLTGSIQVWMIFVFALALGLTNSLDNPTRQSFIYEMVGKSEVKNAVSLWSILISVARIIGPAIAGILIATVGIGQCFILNALSYIAVLCAFFMMRRDELTPSPKLEHAQGQIKAGFDYMRSTPVLYNALIIMAIVGTFTFEWQASIPLLVRFVLRQDSRAYASIVVAMSIGTLFGGILNARIQNTSQRRLVYSSLLLGTATILASFSTSVVFAMISFFFVGLTMVGVSNLSNSILQVHTEPKMRGRIMAFWNMAFQGSTTFGGPLIGWMGQAWGPQW